MKTIINNSLTKDKVLLELVRMCIATQPVSSHIDPSGTIKQYVVMLPNNDMFALELCTETDENYEQHVYYTAYIEKQIVAELRIPTKRKIYTPEEEIIINLMKQFAGKVIWQEQSQQLQMLMGKSIQGQYTA